MNPRTIKVVDAWLGVPLCWVLTVVRRLAALFGRPPTDPPRKIVFLKLIELGAHVQAYTAVRRAAEMVGRENVYFWVFQDSVPILRLLDEVPQQNIIVVRSKGILRIVLDLLSTVWRIRRMKIDTVIDMEFFSRASACLAYLSGATRRVGLHRFTSIGPYRGDLMTHRVQYNPYIHVSAISICSSRFSSRRPASVRCPSGSFPPSRCRHSTSSRLRRSCAACSRSSTSALAMPCGGRSSC